MKDRISALMKSMGMSQKNFAAEICISEGSLSSIFSGRTNPTLNIVNNIHERFPEVNIGWLIDGKGEMFVTPSTEPQQAEPGEGSVPASSSQAGGIPIQLGFMDQLTGAQQMPHHTPYPAMDAKKLDKPSRRIVEIRVFYDDGTFETFSAKE